MRSRHRRLLTGACRLLFCVLHCAALRRKLVDGTVVRRATMHSGAVEISESIDDHTVVRKPSIWRTRKLMNNALYPLTASRTELEDHATSQTAFTRRSIKIAGRVGNKIADRAVAVVCTLKAVNHSLAPFASRPGDQLVNSADTISTTVVSGPIKFSRSSAKQRAVRETPVRLPMEGIERPKIPFSNYCGCELENNSASVSSPSSSCTVEPAMVQKHSACRTAGSIRAASESVNHLKIPRPSVGMNFVNRPYAIRATGWGHTVNIAVPIDSNSRARAGSIVAASKRVDDCLSPRAA